MIVPMLTAIIRRCENDGYKEWRSGINYVADKSRPLATLR